MKKCDYYYFLEDFEYVPFQQIEMINFLKNIFNEESLTGLQVPNDLSTNATIYNELVSLVCSRYREHAIIKIESRYIQEPSSEEINEAFQKWGFKFLALLNQSHYYYVTLLGIYRNAENQLMDDITATTSNKVKFNDTPQNPNTADVYEGDDYITHFTKTEGETTSPLMTKMMRLKEIQEHYRDVMADWVALFERVFYQEDQ